MASFSGKNVDKLVVSGRAFFGEPWRLFSSVLPHADPLHLLFNVYWLWIFETFIEQLLGSVALLGIVLLLGVGASAAEFAAGSIGIGLSGIGFGLCALLYVAERRDPRFADALPTRTVSTFIAWFFLCILLTRAGMWRVANVAHGAGAVLGAALGLTIARSESGSFPALRIVSGALVIALLTLSMVGATLLRPWFNLSKDAGLEDGQLGYAALTEDRNAEAVRLFERAIRLSPKEPSLWYNLGIGYLRTRRPTQASQAFAEARRLNPNDPRYAETERPSAPPAGSTEP